MTRSARWTRALRIGGATLLVVGLVGAVAARVESARLESAFESALEDRRAERGPTPELVPSDDTMRLTVVTYNVWALPIRLPGIDKRVRLPRIPAALHALEADVVALQEAFDVRFRAFAMDYFEPLYDFERIEGCVTRVAVLVRRDCQGGLVTLSTLPIREQLFRPHDIRPEMKWDERTGGKGFLVTTLETPLGLVVVVNVHLYAGREAVDEAQRVRQVARLAETLDSLGHMERPIVLLGDLNVVNPAIAAGGGGRPSDAFALLTDSLGFTTLAPATAETGLDAAYTYDAEENLYAGLRMNRWEGRQIFDYVLARVPDGFEVDVLERRRVIDGDEPLSDHYGVLAVIRLSRGRGRS